MLNQKRLVSRFLKLVKIPSVSRHEKAAALEVKKQLKKIGLSSFFDNAGSHIGGDCGNLYAKVKGTVKDAPVILLNAHIDTIIVEGKIRPVVRKGVIYSDGSTILGADCKTGVAAILEALAVIKEKKLPHGDIKVCFTVAEEIGLLGAKNADARHLKADMGFAVDGGSIDKIISRAPSQVKFKARIHGKASHAGVHPEHGINAIKVASEAISKIKMGRLDKETTSNIGIIEGGHATNIVPDLVIVKGEVRSHSRRKLKRHMHIITRVFSKTCRKRKAFMRLKVEPVYQSFRIDEGSKIMRLAVKAAKGAGIKARAAMTGGGSDANIFNELGIPSLILGVGNHNVHTSKECVAISDLATGTGAIIDLITKAADNGK